MYITYEAIYFVLNSYGNKLHRPFGREMKQRIDHRRWTEIQAIAKQKPEKDSLQTISTYMGVWQICSWIYFQAERR